MFTQHDSFVLLILRSAFAKDTPTTKHTCLHPLNILLVHSRNLFFSHLNMSFHLSSVIFLCLVLAAIANAWHTTSSASSMTTRHYPDYYYCEHRQPLSSSSSSLRLHPDQAPELEAWASNTRHYQRSRSHNGQNDDNNHLNHHHHHGNGPFRQLASGTTTGPVAWCWRKFSRQSSVSSSSSSESTALQLRQLKP